MPDKLDKLNFFLNFTFWLNTNLDDKTPLTDALSRPIKKQEDTDTNY